MSTGDATATSRIRPLTEPHGPRGVQSAILRCALRARSWRARASFGPTARGAMSECGDVYLLASIERDGLEYADLAAAALGVLAAIVALRSGLHARATLRRRGRATQAATWMLTMTMHNPGSRPAEGATLRIGIGDETATIDSVRTPANRGPALPCRRAGRGVQRWAKRTSIGTPTDRRSWIGPANSRSTIPGRSKLA